MPVDKIRYFPPLGWGITQKGVGEYFEDYPTFVYKADVGGFQEKKSVYITTWVKTAFVTQCIDPILYMCYICVPNHAGSETRVLVRNKKSCSIVSIALN